MADSESFFIYGSSSNYLTRNTGCFNTISIQKGYDFLCQELRVPEEHPFLVQIHSSHNDKLWFNRKLPSNLIQGKLPEPILIPRGSTITVEFCGRVYDEEFSSGLEKPILANLALVGKHCKVSPSPSEQSKPQFRIGEICEFCVDHSYGSTTVASSKEEPGYALDSEEFRQKYQGQMWKSFNGKEVVILEKLKRFSPPFFSPFSFWKIRFIGDGNDCYTHMQALFFERLTSASNLLMGTYIEPLEGR